MEGTHQCVQTQGSEHPAAVICIFTDLFIGLFLVRESRPLGRTMAPKWEPRMQSLEAWGNAHRYRGIRPGKDN